MKKMINGKEYTLPCLLHKNGRVWELEAPGWYKPIQYKTKKYVYIVYYDDDTGIMSVNMFEKGSIVGGYCDKKYCNPKVLYTEFGEWHWK